MAPTGAMFRLSAVAVLLLAMAHAALAQADAKPEVIARQVADGLVAAVAAQDADAVARLYLQDAVLLPPGTLPVLGREAIREVWAQSLAGGMRTLVISDIRAERGTDRAAAVWFWTGRGAHPGQAFAGRSLIYFTLTPEGWRISADMWQAAP